MTPPEQGNSPVDAQRLMDAYLKAVLRLQAADDELQAAGAPVDAQLVYAHHLALEDFHTIRGVLTASLRHSQALHAVEGSSS